MTVESQNFTMYANTQVTLAWAGILGSDGALIDITNRIIKFALVLKSGNAIVVDPLIDMNSVDDTAQVLKPSPIVGNPHVQVILLPADSVDLAPIDTVYGYQVEVFENDGTVPVMVTTGDITIKQNAINA